MRDLVAPCTGLTSLLLPDLLRSIHCLWAAMTRLVFPVYARAPPLWRTPNRSWLYAPQTALERAKRTAERHRPVGLERRQRPMLHARSSLQPGAPSPLNPTSVPPAGFAFLGRGSRRRVTPICGRAAMFARADMWDRHDVCSSCCTRRCHQLGYGTRECSTPRLRGGVPLSFREVFDHNWSHPPADRLERRSNSGASPATLTA